MAPFYTPESRRALYGVNSGGRGCGRGGRASRRRARRPSGARARNGRVQVGRVRRTRSPGRRGRRRRPQRCWGAVLEGERVAALPESDQLRGTPILVTDRRGDTWTTTLDGAAAPSAKPTEIVVTNTGWPAGEAAENLDRGRQGVPAGHNGPLSRSGTGGSPRGPTCLLSRRGPGCGQPAGWIGGRLSR